MPAPTKIVIAGEGIGGLCCVLASIRRSLEDGDTLILRGYCEREGAVRIGLGQAVGTVRAS